MKRECNFIIVTWCLESLKAPALVFQAACFTALGFIFMSMSLTFITLDWVYGENRSGGGH